MILIDGKPIRVFDVIEIPKSYGPSNIRILDINKEQDVVTYVFLSEDGREMRNTEVEFSRRLQSRLGCGYEVGIRI